LNTRDYNRARRLLIAGYAFIIFLASGCAQVRPYPNTLAKNLHVHTTTDSGSMFSSVHASVEVYEVDAACKTHYRGVVALDAPTVDIGLAPGRQSFLVFGFASSSWLGNSNGAISQATLLTPRSVDIYDIDVSYIDELYNVVIHETDRNGRKREIDTQRLSACQAKK